MTDNIDALKARVTLRAIIKAAHAADHHREGDSVRGAGVEETLDQDVPRGVPWPVITATACAVARRIADDYHSGAAVFASMRDAVTGSTVGDEERHVQLRVADHDIATVVLAICEQPTGRERLAVADTLISGRPDQREVATQAVFLIRLLAGWAGLPDQIIDDIGNEMLKTQGGQR